MTTYKIWQHIPRCVDADGKEARVSSVEELLALPWVKHWEEESSHWLPREFYRWSYSKDKGDFYSQSEWWRLIAELRGGAEWWVVAHVPIEMETGTLPEWDSDRAMKLKEDAEAAKVAKLASRISEAIADSKK